MTPARLPHRLPRLYGVVQQHPPPCHRLRWAWRNVAVRPDRNQLREHSRRVGLQAIALPQQLGIQPPFITKLLTNSCHQWKAVYRMKTGGTVAA